jgi:hypothetical protein
VKLFATAFALLVFGGAALAVAPPVERSVPPVIVPSVGPPGPVVTPHGGPVPNQPPVNTPEPASMTIAGVSLAAAGVYRFLRRRQMS